MIKRLKLDPFVIAIIVSIICAYFIPFFGSKNGPVPIDLIGEIGIAFIFFFYGLGLNSTSLKHGIKNWKLHLVAQGTTFLVFPIVILFLYPFQGIFHEHIWLAFFFLACLPSAVSSSVVMVSIAKGNLPAAIFNASISGIIGILITPLWMTFFTPRTGVPYDFSDIYSMLLLEIVLPLTLGILLRKFGGKWADANKKKLDIFDKFIVLLIIYKSFVESFESGIFDNLSVYDLLLIGGVVIALFFLIFTLTGWLGRLLKFNREDRITAQFCGTKKSLIHGTVFSEALFGATSIVGVILLPLMLYHAFQIFFISIIATKKAKEIAD